jgi:hypothetical protein
MLGRRLLLVVTIAFALGAYGAAPALAQSGVPPSEVREQPVDDEVENGDNCAESEEGDEAEDEPCEEDAEEEYSDGEAGVGTPDKGGSTKRKPRDSSIPKVRRLRVTAVQGGHRVSFRLSEVAEATLVFARCTIYKPHRCIHYERTDTRIVQKGRRGTNSALVGAGSLAPGRYRVEIHAVDGGHHHSRVRKAVFFVG